MTSRLHLEPPCRTCSLQPMQSFPSRMNQRQRQLALHQNHQNGMLLRSLESQQHSCLLDLQHLQHQDPC